MAGEHPWIILSLSLICRITVVCCLPWWLYLRSRDSNSGSLAWVAMLDLLGCFPTATCTNIGGVGLLLTLVPDAIDGYS